MVKRYIFCSLDATRFTVCGRNIGAESCMLVETWRVSVAAPHPHPRGLHSTHFICSLYCSHPPHHPSRACTCLQTGIAGGNSAHESMKMHATKTHACISLSLSLSMFFTCATSVAMHLYNNGGNKYSPGLRCERGAATLLPNYSRAPRMQERHGKSDVTAT